jgi:hypothetical protein
LFYQELIYKHISITSGGEMNRKQLQIVISLLMVTIHACSSLPVAPIVAPLTATVMNAEIPTSTPTVTPTRTVRPTPTATAFPAWVTNFAEPILAAIKDQPPRFQDDFSYSYGKGWYSLDPKDLWTIDGGVLLVKAPSCGFIENLALIYPNFVLQVDLPGNYGEVVFHGTRNGYGRYSFNVLGQGTTLEWSFGFISDKYEKRQDGKQQFGNLVKTSSAGDITQVIIIKKDSEAAFYLNEIPLAYLDDPFLDAPIYGVRLNCGKFDNVKFWDLDKIPDLP